MAKYFIAGGAGFIGSHLCDRLAAEGASVTCYDNFDPFYDPALKWRNLNMARVCPRVSVVEADIRDSHTLSQALTRSEADCIVHLAAKAGVRPSFQEPAEYHQVNVCGTVNVLEAARKLGVRRVILASSSSVYGNSPRRPFREDDPVDRPLSPYAASKRAMELVGSVYAQAYGLDVVCLRFFTVYGPRQRPDMAIARWVRSVEAATPIQVFGDGRQTRDFTYVEDIVDGIVASLSHPARLGFQVCNLGGACPVTVMELIQTISEVTGRAPVLEYECAQPGDALATAADIGKAGTMFGYRPKVGLRQGLASYLEWVRCGQE